MLPLLTIQTPQTIRVLILQSLNLPLARLLLLRLLQTPLRLITLNLHIVHLLLTTRFGAAKGLRPTLHRIVFDRRTGRSTGRQVRRRIGTVFDKRLPGMAAVPEVVILFAHWRRMGVARGGICQMVGKAMVWL